MKTKDIVKRIDELIEMGNQVLGTRHHLDGIPGEYVNSGTIKGFRAASLSFIERVYGEKHPHFTEFFGNTRGYGPADVEKGLAILNAMRSEIDGGWLFTLRGLVTAEVFADFIDMAEHLLELGYKDPAAVMAGGVLEEHLRQLCVKNGIPVSQEKDDKSVPLKADRLNSELTKADVYSKLDQKLVTAWLDLRNKAAHGKYEEYNQGQVGQMILGVTEFMARIAV
jgi:hypothetical protein